MYIDPPDNWSDTLCDTYTFSGGGFESSPLSTCELSQCIDVYLHMWIDLLN